MPSVTIRKRGPLFNDPTGAMNRGVNRMIRDVAQEGEGRLAEILRPRPAGVFLSVQEAKKGQASVGNYRRQINTIHRDRFARINDGNSLYGPWLEGTGSRNATTRFKGYASFRKVAQWLKGQLPRFTRKWAVRIAQDLGG